MKWQRNPESIDFGSYAYKRKNTDPPVILTLDITTGIPTDTRGWWLGPLETATSSDVETIPCVCLNCKCWNRKGKSTRGNCHKHPPVDNNWSSTLETDFCWEFMPKQLGDRSNE